MALQRYGKIASSYGLIDDLAFGYAGNRMTFVNDAIQASDVEQSFHFNDRSSSSTGNEFEYDGNGNMIKDNNKNITGIRV